MSKPISGHPVPPGEYADAPKIEGAPGGFALESNAASTVPPNAPMAPAKKPRPKPKKKPAKPAKPATPAKKKAPAKPAKKAKKAVKKAAPKKAAKGAKKKKASKKR